MLAGVFVFWGCCATLHNLRFIAKIKSHGDSEESIKHILRVQSTAEADVTQH